MIIWNEDWLMTDFLFLFVLIYLSICHDSMSTVSAVFLFLNYVFVLKLEFGATSESGTLDTCSSPNF